MENDILTIDREESGETTVLNLKGIVNRYTCEQLKQALAGEIERATRVTVLSFAGVTMLDSAGIGILVTTKQEFQKRNKYLLIRSVSERIAQVLKLLRLHELLVVDN